VALLKALFTLLYLTRVGNKKTTPGNWEDLGYMLAQTGLNLVVVGIDTRLLAFRITKNFKPNLVTTNCTLRVLIILIYAAYGLTYRKKMYRKS